MSNRFKDVFSIIGPSMVGPSSSHTAGAARLGRTARQLLGGQPERAEITLYGSFAETYRGHGTDVAIVAGLLDYDTDDERIVRAFEEAEAAGLAFAFRTTKQAAVHPNTASFVLSRGNEQVRVKGCSIGGGNIEIIGVDDFDVKFTANYPTCLVLHEDQPGFIASLTAVLSDAGTNIGYMEVDRKSRSGEALTVIESDEAITADALSQIERLSSVRSVRGVNLAQHPGGA